MEIQRLLCQPHRGRRPCMATGRGRRPRHPASPARSGTRPCCSGTSCMCEQPLKQGYHISGAVVGTRAAFEVVSWIRCVQPRRVGDSHAVVPARALAAAPSRRLLRPRGCANAPTLLFFSSTFFCRVQIPGRHHHLITLKPNPSPLP
jgi:hypothetical protein